MAASISIPSNNSRDLRKNTSKQKDENNEDEVSLENHSFSFMNITPDEEEEEKKEEEDEDGINQFSGCTQNKFSDEEQDDHQQRSSELDAPSIPASIPSTPVNRTNTEGDNNYVDYERLPKLTNVSTASDMSDFSNDSTLIYSTSTNYFYNDCDMSSTLNTDFCKDVALPYNDSNVNDNGMGHDKSKGGDKTDSIEDVALSDKNDINNDNNISTYSTYSAYSTYPFDSDSNGDTTVSNKDINSDRRNNNNKVTDTFNDDFNSDTTLSNNDNSDTELLNEIKSNHNNSDGDNNAENHRIKNVDHHSSSKWKVNPCTVRLSDLNNKESLKQQSCLESKRQDNSQVSEEMANNSPCSPVKSPYFANAKLKTSRKRSTKESLTHPKVCDNYNKDGGCSSGNIQNRVSDDCYYDDDDDDDDDDDGIYSSNRHYQKLSKRNYRLRSDDSIKEREQNDDLSAIKNELNDKVITVTDIYSKTISAIKKRTDRKKDDRNNEIDDIEPSLVKDSDRFITVTDMEPHVILTAIKRDELKMNDVEFYNNNDGTDTRHVKNDCHKVFTVTDLDSHFIPRVASPNDAKLAVKNSDELYDKANHDSCRLIKMFEIVIEPLDIEKTLEELAERERLKSLATMESAKKVSIIDVEPNILNSKHQKSAFDKEENYIASAELEANSNSLSDEDGKSFIKYLTFADRVKLRRRRKAQLNTLKKTKDEDSESKKSTRPRQQRKNSKTISEGVKREVRTTLVEDCVNVREVGSLSVSGTHSTYDTKKLYIELDSHPHQENGVNNRLQCTNPPSKKRVHFCLDSKVPEQSDFEDISTLTSSPTTTEPPPTLTSVAGVECRHLQENCVNNQLQYTNSVDIASETFDGNPLTKKRVHFVSDSKLPEQSDFEDIPTSTSGPPTKTPPPTPVVVENQGQNEYQEITTPPTSLTNDVVQLKDDDNFEEDELQVCIG